MSTAVKLAFAPIRFERVSCPRCGTPQTSHVYSAEDYLYGVPGTFHAESCDLCGLWFQNPRPVVADIPLLYPDTYAPHTETNQRPALQTRHVGWLRRAWRAWNRGFLTNKLGYEYTPTQSPAERLAAAVGASLSCAACWRAGCDLVPRFVRGGRLLEIGCGNGETLRRLRDIGWKDLHGIELSEAAARIARRDGFTVKVSTIESALTSYPDNTFEAIVGAMVLEHLVDPFAVVRQVARKLKPGGEFVFSTVIRDSIDGRIFGPFGVCFDFPRHMIFFRKRDLDEMLRADFDRVKSWRQSTPIDFYRPASLRGGRFDDHLQRFFKSRAGSETVQLLARLRLMGRVSYRCRRKP
jgi:2-polyprenyl-3-methyl-5-hydroxy-6-metoxy-1,4-benzoquinol methylase